MAEDIRNAVHHILPPILAGTHYAISLSTTQLVAVLLIALLTWVNVQGITYGKYVQNVFTVAKLGALAVVITFGLLIGRKAAVIHKNRR